MKKILVIILSLITFSCISTKSDEKNNELLSPYKKNKFNYSLGIDGLENLMRYVGQDFVLISEKTPINQIDINNLGEIFNLNNIIVDRSNPVDCIFNFKKTNDEIETITVKIEKYSNRNDIFDSQYIVCNYENARRSYIYFAMWLDREINIKSSFEVDVSYLPYYIRSKTIIAEGFHPIKQIMKELQIYQANSGRSNSNQKYNVNKLLALLINPLAAGRFGPFEKGEIINTPNAFLRVVDFQQSENNYTYLVLPESV